MNDQTACLAARQAKSVLKMVLAAVSFAVMATFVKLTSRTVSSMEVVFFRSILGSIMIATMIWKEGASCPSATLKRNLNINPSARTVMTSNKYTIASSMVSHGWIGLNPKILVLRGVFGFAALSLHFYAISKLDLGTAVMLNYTAPIFVVIFARLILNEKTTWKVGAAILCSFIGLYLLAGPEFQAKPIPILIGILSGIFAALAYVFIRFNGENESPYTIIFYFTAISTIGSLPLLPLGFHWPNAHEWFGLIGVTIGAFFGQVWLTKSIQGSPVSFILPFSYLTPVFCAIGGAIIWKEYLSPQAIIGGMIIIVSGVAIYMFRERTSFIPLEE